MQSVLLMLALSVGQCQGGNCLPAARPAVAGDVIEWRSRKDEPFQAYLYVNGKQVGGYNRAVDEWRDFDGTRYGDPRPLFPVIREKITHPGPASADKLCICPECDCKPECKCARPYKTEEQLDGSKIKNFGIDRSKVDAEEKWHISGKECCAGEAINALGDYNRNVPDDSKELHLTVIGSQTDRQKVLDDLDKDKTLADMKGLFLVQSYDPGNWAVANLGYVTTGKPTIYIQNASGKVLHRQDVYDGPARLSAAMNGALRNPNPNYDASKDPDLSKTPITPQPAPVNPTDDMSAPGWFWWVLSVAGSSMISFKMGQNGGSK